MNTQTTTKATQTKTSVISIDAYIDSAARRNAYARAVIQTVPVVDDIVEEISPVEIIRDNSKIESSFNVMPDRPVKEEFRIKEYRISNEYGEAIFDREYFSSMEKSPSHLIFITGLIHTQKLLYLVLNKYFGNTYSPDAKETLKIWPTKVSVDMPRMVRKSKDIVQKLWVDSVVPHPTQAGRYDVSIRTDYEGVVTINSEVAVFLI